MKKIILFCIFILGISIQWQYGQLEISTFVEAKAFGDEGGDDDWWNSDPNWSEDMDEVIVTAPDIDWTIDEEWEDWEDWEGEYDDRDNEDYSSNENTGGNSNSGSKPIEDIHDLYNLTPKEYSSLVRHWLISDWWMTINPNQIYLVDINGDGLVDGYIFKDEKGNLHYQHNTMEEVIITPDEKPTPTSPTPGNMEDATLMDCLDAGDGEYFPEGLPKPKEEDCPPKEKVKQAKELLKQNKKTNYGVGNIDSLVTVVREAAKKKKYEVGFTIGKAGNDHYGYKPGNESPIQEGKEDNNFVPLYFISNVSYMVHSHYNGLVSSPSPGDVIVTYEFFRDQYKAHIAEPYSIDLCFEGSIIICSNGSEYLISVDDPEALIRFIKDKNKNKDFTKDPIMIENFLQNSDYAIDYQKTFKELRNKGYLEVDAMSFALSYILDKYDIGLKINKRENKDKDFQQENTTNIGSEKNPNFKLTKCK